VKKSKWEENNTNGQGCPRDSENPLTCLDKSLNKYWRILTPYTQIKLLQYVDDLLISGNKKKVVTEATTVLLNLLGQQVLRVSKSKLQFVQKENKYFGHLISKEK
jgi:hypothetical protein